MKTTSLALAGVAASLFAFPALAHHSFAMFDHNIVSNISGTVKEFEWINPHGWLHIAVMDERGQPVTWSFEMGSVGQMVRDGWKQDTVNAGDNISVAFHPLKDGSHGGQLRIATLPGGQQICQGNQCGNAEGGGE